MATTGSDVPMSRQVRLWTRMRAAAALRHRILLALAMLLGAISHAGPSLASTEHIEDLIAHLERSMGQLATAVTEHHLGTVTDFLTRSPPSKAPAASNAAGPVAAGRTDGGQQPQNVELRRMLNSYNTTHQLIDAIDKKLGQGESDAIRNMREGRGASAHPSDGKQTPIVAEMKSVSIATSNAVTLALKLREDADRIKQAMKEASEKADKSMSAVWTQMWAGIVQGLMPIGSEIAGGLSAPLTDAISRKDPSAFRAALASANVMEVLILAYNASIRDATEDPADLLKKLRETQTRMGVAANRATQALDIAHAAATIVYLGQLIDTGGSGVPASSSDLFTLMFEHQKMRQKAASEDRELELAQKRQEFQAQQASIDRDIGKVQTELLKAKNMTEVKRLQAEIGRLQEYSNSTYAAFQKAAKNEAEITVRPAVDLYRIPTPEELAVWNRIAELRKKLNQQRDQKNALIGNANALAGQIGAAQAEVAALEGDCAKAQLAANALIASSAAAAKAAAEAAAAGSGSWIGGAIGGPVGGYIGTAVGTAVGGAIAGGTSAAVQAAVYELLAVCRDLEEAQNRLIALQRQLDEIVLALATLQAKVKETINEIEKIRKQLQEAEESEQERRERSGKAMLVQQTSVAKTIADARRLKEDGMLMEQVSKLNKLKYDLGRVDDGLPALQAQLKQAEDDCNDAKRKGNGNTVAGGGSRIGGIPPMIAMAPAQTGGGSAGSGGNDKQKQVEADRQEARIGSGGSGGVPGNFATALGNASVALQKSDGSAGSLGSTNASALALKPPAGGAAKPDPCKEVERLKAEIAKRQQQLDEAQSVIASVARAIEEQKRREQEVLRQQKMPKSGAASGGGTTKVNIGGGFSSSRSSSAMDRLTGDGMGGARSSAPGLQLPDTSRGPIRQGSTTRGSSGAPSVQGQPQSGSGFYTSKPGGTAVPRPQQQQQPDPSRIRLN